MIIKYVHTDRYYLQQSRLMTRMYINYNLNMLSSINSEFEVRTL